mgnify:CR=1 FL=1
MARGGRRKSAVGSRRGACDPGTPSRSRSTTLLERERALTDSQVKQARGPLETEASSPCRKRRASRAGTGSVIALRRLLPLAVLALLLTVASPLAVTATAAAEEHHEAATGHEASGHHAPSIGDLMFPAINFAIYLVIIVRFVIPAMRDYLQRETRTSSRPRRSPVRS